MNELNVFTEQGVAMRKFINENKEVLRSIVNVRNDIDNINNKLIEYKQMLNKLLSFLIV